MKYLLSLLALFFSCGLFGQVVITDTSHCPSDYYTLTADVTGIIPISSGITADDNWSAVFPIGFTFDFYAAPNTQCIIGSNGCLGFDLANALAYNTWPISATLLGSSSGAPDVVNCICVPWCDVYIPSGGTIKYSMQGTAPFRTFEVTWCGTAMYSCTTQWLTTQVILYETTNIVEVHIGHHTFCTSWNGGHAIVGVKNAAGTVATTAPGRDYPATWAATDEAWRFTPIAGPSYSVTPITYAPIPYASSTVSWYDSATHVYIGSGSSIVVTPTVTTTYEACVLGCLDTSKGYITLGPPICLAAVNNGPCIGDTLKFDAIGDSIGATYIWSGPGGFTSTSKTPFIFPGLFSDTGVYHCIVTKGGVSDTISTDAIIRPLPVINATSDIPLCGPLYDSLQLYVNPDSTGETFTWTGPGGFTSSLADPIVTPFDSTLQGIYSVTGITRYGCVNVGSVSVYPGIIPGFTFARHYGCYFDTVYFTNTSVNADTYSWNFGDGSPTNTNRNCFHVYSSHDLFYVTLSLSNPHCDTSITIPVDLRHTVVALFSPVPDTFCVGQPTSCLDSSYASVNYGFTTLYSNIWNFGDGSTDPTFAPTHSYSSPGVFPITLVVTDSIGCEDSITKNVYALQLNITSFSDTTLCISQPLPLTNVLTVIPPITLTYSFQWSPGTDLSDSTVQIPDFSGYGSYAFTLTASAVPYGCPATDVITINSVLGKILSNVTATATIELGNSIQLNADSETTYWWVPNDGSLNNPNINDPIATPSHTTLYTVYGYDANGCLDSAYVEVIVDSTMDEEIPGAFTPNNDGLNDVFKPMGEKFQSLVDFRVFNRWGQQVFVSNNFNQGWDGTFNGVPQDIGTYFYTITVARPGGTGENIVYKGEVTLIR